MPESALPVSPEQLSTHSLTAYSSTPAKSPNAVPAAACIPKDFLLPDGTPDYLRLILTSRVYEIIKETPVTPAVNTSARLGVKVLLKREDLQPVFSFKVRGAYNKMAHLPEESRWKGVVACSAGNHAQGVAYSARHLKIPATIVMPVGTPAIKHHNVSRMGSSVVLHGLDFDAAKEECKRREVKYGLTNIAPFDDPYVIAGQGTIAMELLRQCNISELEAVFCCIGGGGLIAGVGVYLKRIAPHVKLIGVETHDANAMAESLDRKERVILKEVGLFADGAAVKVVGEETYRLCQECVDEVIEVSTDEICAAIKDVFLDTRSIVEPAGALAVAGLKKYVAKNSPPPSKPNASYCAVLSGANMDFDRLRFVAERARLGEGKEVLLSVDVPERPGVFHSMIQVILPRAVTEFSYRYADPERGHIFMSITVTDRSREVPEIIARLRKQDMFATDISDDEFAKSHARYLVGGRSSVADERVYRFEFPERPGALAKFLGLLRPGFNISMFHYRNQGGDIGKILAGIQVPEGKREHLEDFLGELEYPFVDETENPNPDDPISLLSAWLALVPQALVVAYTTLIWGQREVELILMFAGQLGCEAVNWGLKRLIKESRPTQMHGKGYGMPSSHAQFVAFFSVYITLWVFLRNKHLPLIKRTFISLLSLTLATLIALSRIYLSYHTPRQVLFGALAGIFLAILWFIATSLLRTLPIKIFERTPWEWLMWAGSFVWVKDMCLEIDLVEHDYGVWKGIERRREANAKNKVN
ncbi:tryptophan synthase beta subunit-like PLP-dependent enzyme [Kalaharituber pfeilii]|nr:tryptophan synthase beta subunit-like PLP-dependent enzyme [Kalaharituber pfeilii]